MVWKLREELLGAQLPKATDVDLVRALVLVPAFLADEGGVVAARAARRDHVTSTSAGASKVVVEVVPW